MQILFMIIREYETLHWSLSNRWPQLNDVSLPDFPPYVSALTIDVSKHGVQRWNISLHPWLKNGLKLPLIYNVYFTRILKTFDGNIETSKY